jgi:hypothetical protein
MDLGQLEKLRKFALTAALILITYRVAGITVKPNAEITAMGIPFVIKRLGLLPFGVALASFFGMLRFLYYGMALGTSPYRKRRTLIDNLIVHFDERIDKTGRPILGPFPGGQTIWMYWGARKFSWPFSTEDKDAVEKRATAFDNAFPKALWARTSARAVREENPSYDEAGDEHYFYDLEVIIPIRCRLAAIFEDLDYSSPVWLNIVALVIAFR